MNIKDVEIGNNKIRKIIDFLNDDKHLETEEVFNATELNEMFNKLYSSSTHLLVEVKKSISEENMYTMKLNNSNRYIFGHPKLIKILKENS